MPWAWVNAVCTLVDMYQKMMASFEGKNILGTLKLLSETWEPQSALAVGSMETCNKPSVSAVYETTLSC